jgi:hypothetical protein
VSGVCLQSLSLRRHAEGAASKVHETVGAGWFGCWLDGRRSREGSDGRMVDEGLLDGWFGGCLSPVRVHDSLAPKRPYRPLQIRTISAHAFYFVVNHIP